VRTTKSSFGSPGSTSRSTTLTWSGRRSSSAPGSPRTPTTPKRRSARGRRLQLLGLLALLAACGGGGGESPELRPSAAAADGWSLTAIARGVKPTLALDGEDVPAVTYVRQGVGGWVEFASAKDQWTPTRIAEGNYAGPADLEFDGEGRPHVAWHDHENAEVSARNGNLVHAVREGGTWQVATARDQGHDGFQTSIAVGGGVVHAAGIEPIQYQTDQGVEHYVLENGAWSVASIGTGALEYEYDVSLALTAKGLPALTYFDDRAGALVYAEEEGGSWTLERIASGETGEFSSLGFDSQGTPHVAFSDERGRVSYAARFDSAWHVEELARGDGPTAVALALGRGDVPYVAFADRGVLRYGVRTGDGWKLEDVATAGRRPLGHRVSLAVDDDGTPHLAAYELTRSKPLRGVVLYATR
jgi:hypothetical protein